MSHRDKNPITRRRLLQSASAAAAALGLRPVHSDASAGSAPPDVSPSRESVIGMRFEPRDAVRVGIIGMGGRGTSLLGDLLAIDKVEVKAVCDVVAEKVKAAQALTEKAGSARPEGYDKSDHDYEQLCQRHDLDLVYIATPWSWHVPMAVSALNAGKHVGVEVPAASTMAEAWALVDASERNRRHCLMLENCCYGENELLVLNMVKAGILGDIVHGEAAYIHDLREILFPTEGEGLWRRDEHWKRNGNLYPTHGLGPVARCMDINRGDRFERLVSMSSAERGLSRRRDRAVAGDPRKRETYTCGDMNTSLIQTAKGRTIVLQHDVVSPRPYDRVNLVSGTGGTFRDYPPRLFLDGQKEHDWQPLAAYKDRFQHPLWQTTGELARQRGGHGGMDYVMSYRLIQCMREGLVPDTDVYDAASWSAPAPLSEQSVAQGSAPMAFPDFTRGRWSAAR